MVGQTLFQLGASRLVSSCSLGGGGGGTTETPGDWHGPGQPRDPWEAQLGSLTRLEREGQEKMSPREGDLRSESRRLRRTKRVCLATDPLWESSEAKWPGGLLAP